MNTVIRNMSRAVSGMVKTTLVHVHLAFDRLKPVFEKLSSVIGLSRNVDELTTLVRSHLKQQPADEETEVSQKHFIFTML